MEPAVKKASAAQKITVNLWLVRHGETFANVKRIIQGQQGGELTKPGMEQADKLGARLQTQRFNKVFCSDLNRCR